MLASATRCRASWRPVRFDSGAVVKTGQVLVELDSKAERAQLASIEARKDLATVNVGRTRALAEDNAISKSQLDSDESALKTSRADVAALEGADRSQNRARTVRRASGHPARQRGPILESRERCWPSSKRPTWSSSTSALPQQRLEKVSVGMPVNVTIEGVTGLAAQGTLAAIDPTVDATTRTLKLRATVPNKDEKLRPGMFAKVAVVLARARDGRRRARFGGGARVVR